MNKAFTGAMVLISMGLMVFPCTTSASTDALELSVLDAIEYAIANNVGLKRARQEQSLAERKEIAGDDGLRISMTGTPQVGLKSGQDMDTSFNSRISIMGEKEIFGGKLSGELSVSSDIIRLNTVHSDVSFSFNRSLFKDESPPAAGFTDVQITIYDDYKNELIKDVIETYLKLFLEEEYVAMCQYDIEIKETQVKAFELQGEDESIIEASREQLEIARNKLEDAKSMLQDRMIEFCNLIGFDSKYGIVLIEKLEPIAEIDILEKNWWIEKAIGRSSSLKQARQTVEDAKSKIESIWDDTGWSAHLSTGLERYQLAPETPHDPNYYVRITISRTLDLTTDIEMEEARLNLEKAEINLERTKEQVTQQAVNGYGRVVSRKEVFLDSLEVLNESRINYRQAEVKHEVGFTGPIELMNSRFELLNAEYKALTNYIDLILEVNDLKYAIGLPIIWDFT